MNKFELSEVGDDVEVQDRKEAGDIAYLNIEGDGVFDSFYEVLWTKQTAKSNVWIPHTVVFKSHKPTAWYYSVRRQNDDVTVVRKKNSYLTLASILEVFVGGNVNCDIAAYFVAQSDDRARPTIIRYLKHADLQSFLLYDTGKENGVLQQFVMPQTFHCQKPCNSMLRVFWSPCVCLIERRFNTNSLTGTTRNNMYERAETFEGYHVNSTEKPLTSDSMLRDLRAKVTSIVEHFEMVSGRRLRLQRLILYMRIDNTATVNLLWVESIRLKQRDRSEHATVLGGALYEKVHPLDLNNKVQVPPRSAQGGALTKCALCPEAVPQAEICTVTYRSLLASINDVTLSHETVTTDPRTRHLRFDTNSFSKAPTTSGNLLEALDEKQLLADPLLALQQAIVENALRDTSHVDGPSLSSKDAIPWFILAIHPFISLRDYVSFKTRPDFLNTETGLCPICFMNLTIGLSENQLTREKVAKMATKGPVKMKNGRARSMTRRESMMLTSPRMGSHAMSPRMGSHAMSVTSNTLSRVVPRSSLLGRMTFPHCDNLKDMRVVLKVSATTPLPMVGGRQSIGPQQRLHCLRSMALKEHRAMKRNGTRVVTGMRGMTPAHPPALDPIM